MSGDAQGNGPAHNPVRSLSSRTILVHYAHLRREPGIRSSSCSFCQQGLPAAITVPKEREPEPDVVPDDGADKGGNSPLPSYRW